MLRNRVNANCVARAVKLALPQFSGNGGYKMTKLFAVLLIAAALAPTIASAGPCDTASDRASDGSRCGDRAADRKPGGK
jgi:hypothetical protein